MIYNFRITTVQNTPKENPQVLEFSPSSGLVKKVEILYPNGCVNLVGVKICDYDIPFIPTMGWVTGNNERLSFSVSRYLMGSPYRIKVITYNIASDWEHTIEINLQLENTWKKTL